MYQRQFTKAFGENAINPDNATKAIAQFERTMISANSKYDQGYLMQPQFANFNDKEYDGYTFFMNEVADCFHCHTEPLFGSFGVNQFENNGLDSNISPGTGREGVTNNPEDRGKFKIPTLRNIFESRPYMHDGRFDNLPEVIEHYDKGGHWSPTVDEAKMTKVGEGRKMTPYQKSAVFEFLKTLSDYSFLEDTAFSDPFK